MKKSTEVTPAVKAVRKMPITSPAPSVLSSQNQNKKKVSTKKDLSTPTHNQACIVLNKVTPSSKDRAEDRVDRADRIERGEDRENKGDNPLRSDLSAVDHKESLCHSFLSNMTSFLSERKSIYLIGGFNE